MPRSAHRLPGRSLLVLALALPTLGLVAPAHAVDAPSTTTLSGTLKLADGAAPSGASVTLYKLNATTSQYAVSGTGTLGAGGTWSTTVTDPDAGKTDSYKVAFAEPGYLNQYFNGASSLESAQPITVASSTTPATLANINGTLTPYVAVSGKVTDDNGTPISGVQVVARGLSADSATGSTWTVTAPIGGTTNTTNASGAWSYDLPPGTYEFEYKTSAYADQYDADAAFIDQGTSTVLAHPGDTASTFTAKLHKPATLTGTVKDVHGNPVSGATATIQYQATDKTWQTATTATTSSTGAWTARVAPTTAPNPNYRVKLSATGYNDAYYVAADSNASTAASDAKLLTESAAATDDLRSATLVNTTTQSGTLTGTVRAADGSIPTGGTIQLYSETITTSSTGARHDVWAAAQTQAIGSNGAYALDEPAGTYRLAFFEDNDAPVFFPSAQGLDMATNLTVAAGQTTTANITLPKSGTVTGHVTLASLPADAVLFAAAPYVSKIDNGVPSVSYADVASPLPSNLTNGSDASYSINLPAGTWVVGASDDNGHTAYYPNAATRAAAQTVTVAPDATVADVDIEIAPAPASLTQAQFTVNPTISGTVGVGSTVTADPGVWLPTTASSPTYQWLADGVAIGNATGQSYKLTSAEIGKRISVKVTVAKAGLPTIVSSAATPPVPNPTTTITTPGGGSGLGGLLISLLGGSTTTTVPTTTASSPTSTTPPVISGNAAVGQQLTASTGSWSATNGDAHYQWYADGQVIPWANSNRHAVTVADAGHALTVKVWFTDLTNNLSGSASSAATPKIGTPSIVNQSAPSISDSAAVGQTLTANTGTWTPTPTSFKYQWLADGSAISGATTGTYVVKSTDAGKKISVAVTPVRTGYAATAATSAAVTVPAATTPGGGTPGNGGTTTNQGAHKPVAVIRIVRVKAQRHGKVVLVADLSAAGTKSFDGVLLIRIGNHKNSAIAHNGRIRIALHHVPKGKKRLRVVFRDSATVLGATTFKWVKVRR